MSLKHRIFLAHSFATDKINAEGQKDQNGISDLELAGFITSWIKEFSGDQIEVIRTRDPFDDYISSKVRRDICSSDLMLCLFTKRTKDHLKHLWIPSTYVISEASAGLMQYPSEDESHRRLFGLVENGVDREQLGMAFPMNKTASEFVRSDLDGLRCKLKEMVDAILNSKSLIRDDREYLSLDKVATVWRNGAITVECRHRYRFTTDLTKTSIPHAIWRVSQPLPPMKTLLNGSRDVGRGYLRCVPTDCGGPGQKTCQRRIIARTSGMENEHKFDIEFSKMDIKAGNELTYELAWGYQNAFHDPTKQDDKPNSVGLRTFERGMARSVSLTVQFQRDFEEDSNEPAPILEEPPVLSTSDSPLLPADTPEFWHQSAIWHEQKKLQPCPKRSGAMWEVYRWEGACFSGSAKLDWYPQLNYLQEDEIKPVRKRRKRNDS
ncbi:hypothetical protein [Gimesia algae]|uniref:TIR domain-containing protein n=1 Tax=Gimesia algae TaxID=2527971 RepID=A0A517VC24_9PLAN|nr:hypothetical protein [Gimesia algae]QDT90539.1 hypothetical protein Pan161_21920 [Gimesia algae]